MQKIIKKSEFQDFIKSLMRKYEVYAPFNRGISKFEKIKNEEDIKEIYLESLTIVPPKQILIPESQELFEFNGKPKEKKEKVKRVIFGLRSCDLNAIEILDSVMKDSQYIQRRKNMILIGLHCEEPDECCFCNSMNKTQGKSDLFFYPVKDRYYVSVNSKEGMKLVKNYPDANKLYIKSIKNYKTLKNKDIERNYKNKIWKTAVEKCLSCGACTVYCPTCNCFDIQDELDINLKTGKRIRKQASCQLKSFSEVAGGKVFRESRESRFKHFVYHKIVYYKKRYGREMCVGCGRCLRVCPTKIDWVEIINLLKSMPKNKNVLRTRKI